MLPREHRIIRGADFRAVMRRGARAGADTLVVSVRLAPRTEQDSAAWRCGFIVSKAVGNSVVRHRTQRRLRHLVRDLLDDADGPLGRLDEQVGEHTDAGPDEDQGDDGSRLLCADVVVRALPEITGLDHPQLRDELAAAVHRAIGKAVRRTAQTPGRSR
ncbi:ribonuclease P protein component [Nesterenkonia marinintestina]|uniref:ribonuclease P protein component n=1 Tax=Nesterenkonia marinintestina TaxID=2979865 RepID=UPI0021C01BAA|nr:ribonuclease P protein component [Nesterenkonia sp. GX14115]